jgi:hypothetical protein
VKHSPNDNIPLLMPEPATLEDVAQTAKFLLCRTRRFGIPASAVLGEGGFVLACPGDTEKIVERKVLMAMAGDYLDLPILTGALDEVELPLPKGGQRIVYDF